MGIITKLIDWVKSWFVSQSQKEPEPEPTADFIVNVDFKIMTDGALENAIYWNYESDQAAVVLGRLLYTITSGALNKELRAILEQKRQENHRFINIVNAAWEQMVDEYGSTYETADSDDEPIVQPDQFLNSLKKAIE